MANPTLRLDFERRSRLQFRDSVVTSDAGLPPYRELDDARTGENGRHALIGMPRQSVFGRLAGYEDVNDAERLRHAPAMLWIVGGKAMSACAASASQTAKCASAVRKCTYFSYRARQIAKTDIRRKTT